MNTENGRTWWCHEVLSVSRSTKFHVHRLWGVDKQMHCIMFSQHGLVRSSFYILIEAESSFVNAEDSKRSKTQTGLLKYKACHCDDISKLSKHTSNTPFSMEKETAHVSNSISCCLISPKTRPTLSCKIWQMFQAYVVWPSVLGSGFSSQWRKQKHLEIWDSQLFTTLCQRY